MQVSAQQFWENHSFKLLEEYKYGQVAPTISKIEREFCSYISGSTLHLFCNFGVNTFALEQYTDKITGLDFSQSAIKYASEFKRSINSKADFICSDFFEYRGSKFDTIYASFGILDWVDNLNKFFCQVKENLKPGGKFILVEFDYDFFRTFFKDIGTEITSKEYLVHSSLSIDEIKSTLGGVDRTKISSKVYLHEMDSIVGSINNSGLTINILKYYDYINFKMSDNDITLGKKKYRYSNLPIDSKMCYGLVVTN